MKRINKQNLLKIIIDRVKGELKKTKEACESANSFKESDLVKQEGNLDTRAVEAGYLAGAHSKRVQELKIDLKLLNEIELLDFGDDSEISIGALVELKFNDNIQTYFISSAAGGTMLKISDQVIMVISIFSPLGEAMIGLTSGDSFELQTPKGMREYLIRSVV